MLEKTYNTAIIEKKISEKWAAEKCFEAGKNIGAETFSMMLPPPNLTGSLHMGHALNNTIQDIIARFMRMSGKDVLWQPGLDHAGIAAQMVVERHLAQTGQPSRQELGREEFLKQVWSWCDQYGGVIGNQMQRLGASCDWSRERFTMDAGLSKAVLEVFVTLYKEGLIYKDKRLVNWDPALLTAISDIEVEQKEVMGALYYIRYPIAGKVFDSNNESSFIIVATTRPETIFGDSAIAVNPTDYRYNDLIGKSVFVPCIAREIPIIADDYVDVTLGSGALKITPAHDVNDFELGKRHKLPIINIFSRRAQLFLQKNSEFWANIPSSRELMQLVDKFEGLDRFEARKLLVEELELHGYLDNIEDHTHAVPHGDRSGAVIEPFLTEQWYVNAKALAGPAIEAVRDGQIKFVPENWQKTYFQWMENIQPWCVSRQLWWGHQIPAWYGPDDKIFVEKTEAEAQAAAFAHYGKSVSLRRDEDVLDTWFSSALWPFSSLGWPEPTEAFQLYYPTDYLVTGFDLIFFWVARMIMMGVHFTHKVPFKTIYMHALVRDKYGAKMSKSKGNVVDPLELIDEYGADALRFTLAIMAAQGRDIKLDPARIAGYRNFATKLWNATRFAQMHEANFAKEIDLSKISYSINSWILHELSQTICAVTEAIGTNRFNDAASQLYKFTWGAFCDWYLELVKPILLSDQTDDNKQEVRFVMGFCLQQIYKLLHPFMPYITEELWQQTTAPMAEVRALAVTSWPELKFSAVNSAMELNFIISLITEIRSVRSQMNIAPSALPSLLIYKVDEDRIKAIGTYEQIIKKLARISSIEKITQPLNSAVQIIINDAVFYMDLGKFIDITAEKKRLEKELSQICVEIDKLMFKFNNENFIKKAKIEIIENSKQRLAELHDIKEKLENAMRALSPQ
ncbi:valine--tRNA ligase [Bartonella sp. TP]|uniref:valine--tRNA ligase n=1 Tax=Bartonella sp. TP TaxID=3057550 RepID=UPI0025AFC8D6|nr:valine--tRNA ligase [Bartonella sp. TP]WJW79800.1 valine--tRNA ligase [Bartonella sp. TP]